MEPYSWFDVIPDIMPENMRVETSEDEEFQKLKRTVLNDIQRSNDFYTSKIEPVLRVRHQIYEADREYYKKRFRNTGAQSDFVSIEIAIFLLHLLRKHHIINISVRDTANTKSSKSPLCLKI